MGRKKEPNKDTLLAMTEHIAYDVWLAHVASARLYAAVTTGMDRASTSLLLEGVLIHTRNVLGFLYPPPEPHVRPGDILARDYPAVIQLPQRAQAVVLDAPASQVIDNISKRVVHIHEWRADPGVQWSYLAIAEVAVVRCLRYLSSVHEPYRSAFAHEFDKLGWPFEDIVRSLPGDESHFPSDLVAMRANPA